VGIIQEQHPDRCRLFMQWKRMNWPILVDALNQYGVSAVPITYAIDQAGIVRAVNPKPAELDAFLESPARETGPPPPAPRPDIEKTRPAAGAGSAAEWGAYADALFGWIEEARAAIRARGEEPSPLVTEPSGSEIAAPAERFAGDDSGGRPPDPSGRVRRDTALIRVDAAVVPPAVGPDSVTRVHLLLVPNAADQAHWNNEAEPLRVWLDPPGGWSVDRREARAPQPPAAVSTEPREVQFELKAPPVLEGRTVEVPGYALYYVCQEADGVCLFRRQDFILAIGVSGSSPRHRLP